VKDLWKKTASVRTFLLEIVVYACFVSAYLVVVLHYLSGWIKQVFDDSKLIYAIVAVVLIGFQGAVLERLTSGLLRMVERLQGVILVLKRLARPHETVTRPEEVSGLLVYRFAGPLFFFNAAHFANRVQELIDSAKPAVRVLLINAEAIVDMDQAAAETLADLHEGLKEKDILLGICEAKGHFLEVLGNIPLTEGSAFHLYPSVAAAIRQIKKEQSAEE
jgi:MFS superfamily sulfate permease-like transporter